MTLAATDVGLGAKQMGQLSRTAQELSQSGVSLSRGQWSDGLKAAQEGEGAVQQFIGSLKDASASAKEKIRRVLASVHNGKDPQAELVDVPRGTVDEVDEAKQLGQPVQTKGNAGGTATTRKPPKALEAYANAGSVKPFIGTNVDPNHLPEGYLYGKIPTGKDALGRDIYREVVYMPKPKNTTVPLVVENGRIALGKEGEYRIVQKAVYDANVVTDPGKVGKLLGGKSQVHHMYADNMLRNTPFGQRALRLGAVNPDGSINLIELASSKGNLVDARKDFRDVKFSDFVHNTQHPKFDGLMQRVVNDAIKDLRKAKGLGNLENLDFIPRMTKADIQEVWNEALTKMKAGLMGEDKALYKEIEKRTRPGKKSLAQGEKPDNSEVA